MAINFSKLIKKQDHEHSFRIPEEYALRNQSVRVRCEVCNVEFVAVPKQYEKLEDVKPGTLHAGAKAKIRVSQGAKRDSDPGREAAH